MNWLLVVVGIIFLVGVIVGAVRGFVRIGISLAASVLTVALVIFLTPYISQMIEKFTPVDEVIEEKCMELFMPSVSAEDLANADLSGTPLEGYEIPEGTDIDLEDYGLSVDEISQLVGDVPQDTQIQLIEQAPLPQILKDSLLENNNTEIYDQLGVSTFLEYIASYISDIVIRIVSFLVTFLFAIVLVRSLLAMAELLTDLPILRGLDQIAGALLGFLASLLLVWILFLVITLLLATPIGMLCLDWISSSAILTFLYEKNVLLSFLLS